MSKNSLIAIIVVIVIVFAGVAWWYVSSAHQQVSVAPAQQNVVANNEQGNSAALETLNPGATNSTASNGLVGTWVSTTKDKGMQGTGKIVLPKSTTQFTISGDVNLVISKVENNIGTGTISYTNLCTTETTTYTTGKAASTKKLPCERASGKPVQIKIDGNKITATAKTSTDADISFTGNYTNSVISGTVVVKGTYGDMTGTFSLTKLK